MVHRSENEQYSNCSDCGAVIAAGAERGFLFGSDGVLCWECALRRGGAYDARHECWTRSPRVDDLLPRHERERY